MANISIFELRRQNLDTAIQQLIQLRNFKNGKALCEHYQLSVSHISQLINSHRQIGEKTARELEQQIELPVGYLDQEDVPTLIKQQGIPCYAIAAIQDQLFQLEHKSYADFLGLISSQQLLDTYFLYLNTNEYEPVFKQNWFVLCSEKQALQSKDLALIYFKNRMNLLLHYQYTQGDELHFYSVDGQQHIQIHADDIERIDVILAMFSPHQIQLL